MGMVAPFSGGNIGSAMKYTKTPARLGAGPATFLTSLRLQPKKVLGG